MSVHTIRVGGEPSEDAHPGAIDVTELPVRELERTVSGVGAAGGEDVYLERVPGRTYLVARPDR